MEVDSTGSARYMKNFRWLPQNKQLIQKKFECKSSTRLRDMFTIVRRNLEQPIWIIDVVWADLLRKYCSPEYTKKESKPSKIEFLIVKDIVLQNIQTYQFITLRFAEDRWPHWVSNLLFLSSML